MINIKPQIYKAVCDGCPTASVSDEYPVEWVHFPKITITEENNAVSLWTDNAEQFARIVYRIDVWDKQSTSSVASQVDAAMSALGMMRTMAMDSPVPEDCKHKQMRYECLIDTRTEDVFH